MNPKVVFTVIPVHVELTTSKEIDFQAMFCITMPELWENLLSVKYSFLIVKVSPTPRSKVTELIYGDWSCVKQEWTILNEAIFLQKHATHFHNTRNVYIEISPRGMLRPV